MRTEEEVLEKIKKLSDDIKIVDQMPDVRSTAKLELEQQLKALLWATNSINYL